MFLVLITVKKKLKISSNFAIFFLSKEKKILICKMSSKNYHTILAGMTNLLLAKSVTAKWCYLPSVINGHQQNEIQGGKWLQSRCAPGLQHRFGDFFFFFLYWIKLEHCFWNQPHSWTFTKLKVQENPAVKT